MKTGMRWMALAAAVLVSALVSTSAWAIWDPDGDAALKFNMNFQIYNNPAHTTTDAELGLIGTVFDYNTTNPNIFGEAGKVGFDANFAAVHDIGTGAGFDSGVESPNDVKLKVPSNTIFNLGGATIKNTWFFWFNLPNLIQGTIINHTGHTELTQYVNKEWEIRVHGGKLHFWHKDNCLKMETAYTLAEMGFTTNTWYSAAVVIDRTNSRETSVPTTQLSTKIYIDGLEVPVIVTSLNNQSMNVDYNYDKPLWIGAGERDFDGLLDDVRLYSRDLNAIEVSILNQPDTTQPRALLPIPGSENVVISANLTWDPADGAATQVVFFGTDPENLTQIASGGGALESVDPCAGLLALDTEYFWYVNTNGSDGPLWSFISETGRALNPSPADGEEDINNSDVNMSWFTPTPATYAVYVSTNWLEVNDLNVNAQRASGLTDPCLIGFDPCNIGGRGQVYFWRVVSTYAGVGTIAGDIWSFRTRPYELVFNTSGLVITYADQPIPAYTCVLRSDGWTPLVTGSLDGTLADGNAIAVFNFPGPNYFNYDRRYDIIVVPEYRATDVNDVIFPTPLAIHTTGDFYFDGRIQIAGDDILTTSQDNTFARSGGYPGPKHNQDESVFPDDANDNTLFWEQPSMPAGNHARLGAPMTSAKTIFIPTALGKSVWGPGQPVNPPYKGGGGGGAGGMGGEAGRGYYFGIDSRGPSYGDEEVPIPFGGSSGGWGGGSSPGGAAGGGGIEIVASGNVVFDSNSQIIANGGSQLCSPVTYPAGGGGGGSVRIIAGGSVTNKGIINVSGGKGGDGSGQGNNTGGGGGGGRVAIFYGADPNYYSNTGSITADGGARGTYQGTGLAQDGQNGTIFDSEGGSPKKASLPTPADGDVKVYAGAGSVQLKWYSGYGGTTDVVYCDTNPNPTTQVPPGGSTPATRGQHSVTKTVSAGNTYYWKVVTDGSVESDVWSFSTVNWECPFAISNNAPHVGGPEWDFNHNCIIDIEDFAGFAQDWVNVAFGTYIIDNPNFANFAGEWKMCDNRTDGCNDWPD